MKKPLLLRRVVGHSMVPTLKPDQLVIASGWLKPRAADLVVAEVEGVNVVKRVNRSTAGQVVLYSDSKDHGRYAAVPPSSILGRVISVR